MTLSLNEVEALAKKATRGAGYPWGIAEEAGKAVRWLCAMDIDGCAALAGHLDEVESSALDDLAPRIGRVWSSRSGRCCPLLAGAALSDFAVTLAESEVQLENTAYPVLLAPFAAMAAQELEDAVALGWGRSRLVTNGECLSVFGKIGAKTATVTVRCEQRFERENAQQTQSRANPKAHSLAVLNRLAHRTYAPATEESRLSGAGAGLSDND